MLHRKLTKRLSEPGLRLGALPLSSKLALLLIVLVVALAVFAPLIAGSPLASGTPVQPPSSAHWFGTDAIGRDIFARVAFGARSSLIIGIFATALALALAAVVGSVAATAPKWIAETLMRIMDVIMSFPGIALAAVFVAVYGNSIAVLVLAIGIVYMPQLTRIVRANALAQLGEDYVAATRVTGAGMTRIMFKHVARNCLAPVLVFATVLVAEAIVLEASLSFINAGIKPPNPSWGNILSDGKSLLLDGTWWPTFFPGVMILLTVLALNVLSEGMTDAMVSPAARKNAAIDEASDESLSALTERPGDDREAPLSGDADSRTPDDVPTSGRAPATQAPDIPLDERLDALRTVETARSDRLVYQGADAPILEVENLSIAFPEAHGDVDIVDEASFSVRPGETMGLVGESGCGKSITSMAIMGLLPRTARISGRIMFDGRNLLELSASDRNALRGHDIAMVYQDALSSLNPSMLIRSQLAQLTKRGGKRTASELLELVGLDPKRTLASYPHELSGGQRQRVLIAMALTRNPRLVIADEPTTALDVTVQRQVVDLLNSLRTELGFAMVFVSHDLALVAQLAHRITVMYAGQVVESGTTRELLTDPRHEYTRGMLGAVLSIEQGSARLHQVPGTVPSPGDFVAGDRFAPRSSTPEVGLDVRPQVIRIPGSTHYYAGHPDLETSAGGIQ